MIKTHEFTAEERQIAKGIVRGDPTQELCRKLRISENRLRTDIKHMQRKTHSHNREELMARLTHTGMAS